MKSDSIKSAKGNKKKSIKKNIKESIKESIKEKNLAYGGQALIEGVLMRGQAGYAFTVKKEDNTFYKEKNDYTSICKRIKFFGLPFIRGIFGLFENLMLGVKILNKSAEVAFPEEENKGMSNFGMALILIFSLIIAMGIFKGIPYLATGIFNLDHNNNPILYNLVSGLLSLLMFFIYIVLISLMKDMRRVFGYHGAEHKTISAYESKENLTVTNVKKYSRLHPRCGTSFIFIVFLVSIIVFPFFSIFFNTQIWYVKIKELGFFGIIIQRLIHFLAHIIFGLPIVASLSYELLKLSAKFQRNVFFKIFILPGLFFQLFTTKDPDDVMIKSAILSLKMVLGEEKVERIRKTTDNISSSKLSLVSLILMIPFTFFI